MTFTMPITISDENGEDLEVDAEIYVGGPRDEVIITATVGDKLVTLTEEQQDQALQWARDYG